MQSQTLAGAIAAGAALAAAALVLVARTPSGTPPAAPAAAGAEPPRAAPAAREAPRDAASPAPEPAAAKVRELEAMAESFRSSTFLIAIRDAGFVCNELLRVSGGFDDAAKWVATCSEMLAYTIEVTDDGALRVEPLQQYFDGVAPR
jgi:hypothetical protein